MPLREHGFPTVADRARNVRQVHAFGAAAVLALSDQPPAAVLTNRHSVWLVVGAPRADAVREEVRSEMVYTHVDFSSFRRHAAQSSGDGAASASAMIGAVPPPKGLNLAHLEQSARPSPSSKCALRDAVGQNHPRSIFSLESIYSQ